MAKYNKKRVRHICSLIEKDSYTIAEICSLSGISESTYYEWMEKKSEFSEMIKSARDRFEKMVLVECEKSLIKLAKGYEVEEKKTVTVADKKGLPTIKEQTITKKHFQPSLGAIIHYQTNKDPWNWKNRQTNELTGKDGKELFPKITVEVINSADQVKKNEDTGS